MDKIQSVDQPSISRMAIGYWTHAILPIGWWLFFVVLIPWVMEPISDLTIIQMSIPLWLLIDAGSIFIQYPVIFAQAILVLILADGIVYVRLQSGGQSQVARWWRRITFFLQSILTLELGLALFVSLVWATAQ